MAIRKYKPTTPGRRGSSVADFVEITRTTPEKSLTRPLPKKGGRNNQGRITTRHQGGGHKRAYRVIDFRRYDKEGLARLLVFLTFLSANLAVLNFLPIPALDGGHMLFLLAEGVRGKPLNERLQVTLTLIGVGCLLSLMVLVFTLDIQRFF